MVDAHILISSRDTLLITIPFVLMLLISMFRLDEMIAAPRRSVGRRRSACGVDEFGEPILCDPDGRLSEPGPKRRSVPSSPRAAEGQGPGMEVLDSIPFTSSQLHTARSGAQEGVASSCLQTAILAHPSNR
jgi:hypothetical protein